MNQSHITPVLQVVISKESLTLTISNGCVSMGSMGSVETIECRRRVPEPMDFEHIVKQMQGNKMFEV